jgi:dolichol-phosphate mannosyltransferase|tara:strand:+ start:49 stop:762 length:714 start_codon:yes stop_codon:yes gene_type:complete
MLSVIIPARNESDNLKDILRYFTESMDNINYEVLLINDFSEDDTFNKASVIFNSHKNFRVLNNEKKGLGGAINLGIKKSNGTKVAIMMADLSDDINDLKKYNKIMDENKYDAVLGSRFLKESLIKDYPIQKLFLNRLFNFFVSLIFINKYNDYTNAFKIYKKDVLKTMMPFVSESFNIFLEIPLKIISRNYSYKITNINWYGRKRGKAKFKIKELRSKYLFTLIYCFLEKILLNIKK